MSASQQDKQLYVKTESFTRRTVHSQGQQQSQQAKQRNERGDRFRLSAGRVSAPHLPSSCHLVVTTCTSCLGLGNNGLRPEHIPTIIIAQHRGTHASKDCKPAVSFHAAIQPLGLASSCTTMQQVVESALDICSGLSRVPHILD